MKFVFERFGFADLKEGQGVDVCDWYCSKAGEKLLFWWGVSVVTILATHEATGRVIPLASPQK